MRTTRRPRHAAGAVAAMVLALLAGCASASPSGSPSASGPGLAPSGEVQTATLIAVSDGDSIRVEIDGVEHRVRYIGIDTPEIGDAPEPLALEARRANRELLGDGQLVLERDVSETDRFGRLLRYVWVRDGAGADVTWTLVNLEMLRLGMARVVTFPPDVKYHDSLYLPAERAAREAQVGIWEP